MAVASGILGGGLAGGIATGTAEGALIGALTGGAMGYAGDNWPAGFGNAASHAVIGCASSSLSGGGCQSGALSGGFGSLATQNMPEALQANHLYQFAYVTVVGGTASVIGGGKFANGAETAAYGYLFNCATHGCQLQVRKVAAGLSKENAVVTFSFFYPSDENPPAVGQIDAVGKNLAADLVVTAAEIQRVGNIVSPFVGFPASSPKSFIDSIIDSIKGYFSPTLQISNNPKIYAGQLRETFGNAAKNQSALVHKSAYEIYKQGL